MELGQLYLTQMDYSRAAHCFEELMLSQVYSIAILHQIESTCSHSIVYMRNAMPTYGIRREDWTMLTWQNNITCMR